MKKYISLIIVIAILSTTLVACSGIKKDYTFDKTTENDNQLAIVSFNCASPWGNLLKGTYSGTRVKRFAGYMNAVKPDSIGTQEMNFDWINKLSKLMPEYESYGVKRGGDDKESTSETNALFWLKDKYTCKDKNTFWLSETPEKESVYEGSACYRICSYVLLENNETGKSYIHMNTHLDHISDDARVFGANVIIDKILELREKYGENIPIVLTGDFNDTVDTPMYNAITNALVDSRVLAGEQDNKSITYQAWGELNQETGSLIDFIFTTEKATTYCLLDDTSNGYVSDHYGVYSIIELR